MFLSSLILIFFLNNIRVRFFCYFLIYLNKSNFLYLKKKENQASLILSESMGELLYVDLSIYDYGDLKVKCGLEELILNISCAESKEAKAQEFLTKYCLNCPKLVIENVDKKIGFLKEAGFFDRDKLKSMMFSNKISKRS